MNTVLKAQLVLWYGLCQPTFIYLKKSTMLAAEETEHVIDFKKLKRIFSNNSDIMEQVMHGLIVTAHQKTPDLERYYEAERWTELTDTVAFIRSAYQHVSTEILHKNIERLGKMVEDQKKSKELDEQIQTMRSLSRNMINDIEYYLSN